MDTQRIAKMLQEGKISSKQAELLTGALKESERRRERITQELAVQKEQRTKNNRGLEIVLLAILAVGSLFLFFAPGPMNHAARVFLFIFLLLVVSVTGVVLLLMYNVLVKREERVAEAWAQIGTLYQRKLDLIPALLEVVKDFARHEKETLQNVITARQQAYEIADAPVGPGSSAGADVTAPKNLDLGLTKIQVLAEQYPDLKANVHYSTMQEELTEAEDGIARAKQTYNHRVQVYNAGLRLFPLNLMAAAFTFQPKEYLPTEK